MLILCSLVFTIIFGILSFVFWKLTFWSRRGVPNDLTSRLNRPFHISDWDSHRKYGKVVGFYEGIEPCLSITDPKLIKEVLVTNFKNFANHREQSNPSDPVNKGLFFLPYSEWKRIRTILSTAFTTGKMKALKPMIDKSLDQMIEQLDRKAKDYQAFDFKNYIECFSFDIISKSSFGLNLDPFNNPDNAIFKSLKQISEFSDSYKTFISFVYPKIASLLDLTFFNGESQKCIFANMKSVINERLTKNIKINDLLQQLIDSSVLSKKGEKKFKSFEKLTEEEVFANSLNLMIAGFDTVATQVILIAKFLAQNPEYHDKLMEEIQLTFDDNLDITYEKLWKMPYLDAFIKEQMRLTCPVNRFAIRETIQHLFNDILNFRIDRRTVRDCYLGDIHLPKNTSVVIPIWTLHRDPDFFDEPEVFKPERFMSENVSDIDEYSYLPFATGPRNCIGRRMALLLIKCATVRLVSRFRFEQCQQTKHLEFYNYSQITKMKKMDLKITRSK